MSAISKGRTIWYRLDEDEYPAKDVTPNVIYVFEDSAVSKVMPLSSGDITMGELSNMTDDEIIEWIEEHEHESPTKAKAALAKLDEYQSLLDGETLGAIDEYKALSLNSSLKNIGITSAKISLMATYDDAFKEQVIKQFDKYRNKIDASQKSIALSVAVFTDDSGNTINAEEIKFPDLTFEYHYPKSMFDMFLDEKAEALSTLGLDALATDHAFSSQEEVLQYIRENAHYDKVESTKEQTLS